MKKLVINIEPPKKTFFYEKPNGEIFGCEEEEASGVHRFYKQIGVSDGTVYNKILQEIKDKLEKAYDELDELEINDMPKAKLRAKKIKSNIEKSILFAQQQELEHARGNFKVPSSKDYFNINGEPIDGNDFINEVKNIKL